MEYGISALITGIFLLIYLFTRKTHRESFTKRLSNEDFLAKLEEVAKNFSLPNQYGKKDYAVKNYIKRAKYACFWAKKFKIKYDLNYFDGFIDILTNNKMLLKKLKKENFSKISELPFVGNDARIEKIGRLILESNGYMLIDEKIENCFNKFNKISTISFPEIKNFQLVIKYIYLEKLYFVSNRIIAICKLANFARKVARHNRFFVKRNIYLEIQNNNVFLHLSSYFLGQKCASAKAVFCDVIQDIHSITSTIFDNLNMIDAFEFENYYSPLQILDNYEAFYISCNIAKNEFLTELSNQATKLNMDEYAYTLSLKKYTDRAEDRYIHSKQFNLGILQLRMLNLKQNLRSLAISLSSPEMLNFLFGIKKSKRILKNDIFKNTFSQYLSKKPIKLGIFISENKISINPVLPSNFKNVNIIFAENGIDHHIAIEKGEVRELYCNGTKYDGIPVIKLGDKPLNILLKTPPTDC